MIPFFSSCLFLLFTYFLAQLLASPVSISIPCSSSEITYSKHSRTALGLPGRFKINVFFLIPAAARLSIALLVNRILYARIASGMPGTMRSVTDKVASGMQSRGENPVPPDCPVAIAKRALSGLKYDIEAYEQYQSELDNEMNNELK